METRRLLGLAGSKFSKRLLFWGSNAEHNRAGHQTSPSGRTRTPVHIYHKHHAHTHNTDLKFKIIITILTDVKYNLIVVLHHFKGKWNPVKLSGLGLKLPGLFMASIPHLKPAAVRRQVRSTDCQCPCVLTCSSRIAETSRDDLGWGVRRIWITGWKTCSHSEWLSNAAMIQCFRERPCQPVSRFSLLDAIHWLWLWTAYTPCPHQ